MTLTITLEEPLAGQLREAAARRGIVPEQLARDILEKALRKLAVDQLGSQLNVRRIELLNKSINGALTEEESAELDRLTKRQLTQ